MASLRLRAASCNADPPRPSDLVLTKWIWAGVLRDMAWWVEGHGQEGCLHTQFSQACVECRLDDT